MFLKADGVFGTHRPPDVLAIGTPGMVRDTAVRAIEDTEGRLLANSDSEIANSVPLVNFLALREAILTYAV